MTFRVVVSRYSIMVLMVSPRGVLIAVDHYLLVRDLILPLQCVVV